MSKFKIVTDATSDLPAELVEKFNIDYIPMELMLNGNEARIQFLHERDHTESAISYKEFYERMEKGAIAKTSLINTATIVEKFTPILKAGFDVLYVAFDSGLSATYQQALLAKEELEETFKDRRVVVVDSLSASLQEGFLVLEAFRLQNEGKTIDQIADFLDELKGRLNAVFTVAQLDTLKRGGRISSTKAFIANIFKIKPVLHVNDEGKLVPVGTVRGRKNALRELVEVASKNLKGARYEGTLLIAHANCLEEAEYVANYFKEKLGYKDLIISDLGPVITAHAGNGTVAMIFEGLNRKLS